MGPVKPKALENQSAQSSKEMGQQTHHLTLHVTETDKSLLNGLVLYWDDSVMNATLLVQKLVDQIAPNAPASRKQYLIRLSLRLLSSSLQSSNSIGSVTHQSDQLKHIGQSGSKVSLLSSLCSHTIRIEPSQSRHS